MECGEREELVGWLYSDLLPRERPRPYYKCKAGEGRLRPDQNEYWWNM